MEIETQGSASEIYSKLKTRFEAYQKAGKIKQVKELKFEDSACRAVALGSGFKSTIQCKDGKVVVDLDLNFLLKPMRGQIEDGIRSNIKKALG